MANGNNRADVAVFIDFENVYVSVRDKLDANPNFETIMDRCADFGRVVISRAYADWYRYPRVTSALYANAIEPMYVPTYYYDREMGRTGRAIKNSVDIHICIDAMKTLFISTNIAKFVLVTGDRDFIPLVNSIRQQGKEVIVIGIGGAASSHLAQSADEFIFYEQLVGHMPTSVIAAPPPTPAPPEERPRGRGERERERPQEPVAPPVAAPTPPTPPAEPDIYDTLVEAIRLARKRNYVSTLGSLKLLMKELMGDFRENKYRDNNGRPFAKFKDFVLEAERRGKVQVFTSGTVNEVFLPEEDPLKLSQFATVLTEAEPTSAVELVDEPEVAEAEVVPEDEAEEAETTQEAQPATRGRRRRRRGGRERQPATSITQPLDGQEADAEVVGDLELRPSDELVARVAADLGISNEQVSAVVEQISAELPEILMPVLPPYDPADDAKGLVGAVGELPDEAIMADQEAAPTPATEAVVADEARDEQAVLDEAATPEPPPQTAAVDEAGGVDLSEASSTAATAEPTPETAAVDEAGEADVVAPAPETAAVAVDESGASIAEAMATPSDESASATATTAEAALSAPAPQASEAAENTTAAAAFRPEEWATFYQVLSGFDKAVSFRQIFTALRDARNDKQINRTNPELEAMIKQAINDDMFERSGRGARITYRLQNRFRVGGSDEGGE